MVGHAFPHASLGFDGHSPARVLQFVDELPVVHGLAPKPGFGHLGALQIGEHIANQGLTSFSGQKFHAAHPNLIDRQILIDRFVGQAECALTDKFTTPVED